MIQIVSTFVLLAFKMFLDKPRALTIRFIRSSKSLNNGGDNCFPCCLDVRNIASRQFECYFDITVRGMSENACQMTVVNTGWEKGLKNSSRKTTL